MAKSSPRPLTVFLLAPFPGVAHLVFGRRAKGAALSVILIGITAAWFFSDMLLPKLLATGIYFATAIPAALELLSSQETGKPVFDADAKWYVSLMLLMTGFNALPLLWQNDRFSRGEKIGWSIAVPLLAVLFFIFLVRYWMQLENRLQGFVGG